MSQKTPDGHTRLHIWVKGRVQGVGFRAHVAYTGQSIGLGGWVRNVGWDRVEAMAEGDRAALERFLEAVKAGPRGAQVDEARADWETPTGEFDTFEVRHSI